MQKPIEFTDAELHYLDRYVFYVENGPQIRLDIIEKIKKAIDRDNVIAQIDGDGKVFQIKRSKSLYA